MGRLKNGLAVEAKMTDVASVAKRNAQTEIPMNSEPASLSPIAAPVAVRWREFRIRILPMLAFGGALALAGLLVLKAVVPGSTGPATGSPPLSPEPAWRIQPFSA